MAQQNSFYFTSILLKAEKEKLYKNLSYFSDNTTLSIHVHAVKTNVCKYGDHHLTSGLCPLLQGYVPCYCTEKNMDN